MVQKVYSPLRSQLTPETDWYLQCLNNAPEEESNHEFPKVASGEKFSAAETASSHTDRAQMSFACRDRYLTYLFSDHIMDPDLNQMEEKEEEEADEKDEADCTEEPQEAYYE